MLNSSLSRGPKIWLEYLVSPSGERTQSKGWTSDLHLATHFPNSIIMEGIHVVACRKKRLYWRVTARIVTNRRVRWAIDLFVPYKIPGMWGILPALLQGVGRSLFLNLSGYFVPACRLILFPNMWHHVKVVFIPKPAKSSYFGLLKMDLDHSNWRTCRLWRVEL